LGGCNNLIGLSVTVIVDQDIVAVAGSNGFGFQINAYSAKGDYDGAQQYVVLVDPSTSPPQMTCMVDNWESKSQQLVNIQDELAALQTYSLPAGYKLTISLINDDFERITGATYLLMDNQGHTIGNRTISFSDRPAMDLAPIVAFQMNFVGDINGATTTLSSGAGTMTYAASNLMSVLNTEPACVDWTFSTVEAANSAYGLLPSAPSQTFTQSFELSIGGKVIHRVGKVRHKLRRA
jgi:hypothetical protein